MCSPQTARAAWSSRIARRCWPSAVERSRSWSFRTACPWAKGLSVSVAAEAEVAKANAASAARANFHHHLLYVERAPLSGGCGSHSTGEGKVQRSSINRNIITDGVACITLRLRPPSRGPRYGRASRSADELRPKRFHGFHAVEDRNRDGPCIGSGPLSARCRPADWPAPVARALNREPHGWLIVTVEAASAPASGPPAGSFPRRKTPASFAVR